MILLVLLLLLPARLEAISGHSGLTRCLFFCKQRYEADFPAAAFIGLVP